MLKKLYIPLFWVTLLGAVMASVFVALGFTLVAGAVSNSLNAAMFASGLVALAGLASGLIVGLGTAVLAIIGGAAT